MFSPGPATARPAPPCCWLRTPAPHTPWRRFGEAHRECHRSSRCPVPSQTESPCTSTMGCQVAVYPVCAWAGGPRSSRAVGTAMARLLMKRPKIPVMVVSVVMLFDATTPSGRASAPLRQPGIEQFCSAWASNLLPTAQGCNCKKNGRSFCESHCSGAARSPPSGHTREEKTPAFWRFSFIKSCAMTTPDALDKLDKAILRCLQRTAVRLMT